MKYIVMLGDGMADYKIESLGGKTPLEVANKPTMDFLARHGETGMVKTVPDGMKPASDVANLSVMGYDPLKYYSGRSPLEAVSMGIEMSDTDMAFRCNLVSLGDEPDYASKTMVDYSSDEITTPESRELIAALNRELPKYFPAFGTEYELFAGISYRHCLIWHKPRGDFSFTPPHDISGKCVKDYTPKGSGTPQIFEIMKKSYEILSAHPVNLARKAKGLRPANSMWIWGEGKKPALTPYKELYGVDGAVVSAVDLIKGIGILAGLEVLDVEGATGNINTNFKGKGEAALKSLLDGKDFVYIHVEAADESGHRFELENKIKAIEKIDSEILAPILEGLKRAREDYAVLLLPDHPTPLSTRTHARDPVPFVLYTSVKDLSPSAPAYNEFDVSQTNFVPVGCELIKKLFAVGK